MPSGKVHLRIEMIILLLLLAPGIYMLQIGLVHALYVTVFLAAYLFSSLLLSPDLDLVGSDPFRRWGMARVLWVPYARLFHHRALSHHIIFGPLTRIAYLGGITSLAYIGIVHFTGWHVSLSIPQWPVIAALVSGLYLPNQIHTVADAIWSKLRHR